MAETMKERIQVWMSRTEFAALKSALESSRGDLNTAVAAFDNEQGPLVDLLDNLEQAVHNNANYDLTAD